MSENGVGTINKWKALFILCFANFLVMMDSAIIQIALPSIKLALGYSQENLQWVMSAFLIFFGGLLLLGGRLADLIGNKKIFNLGVFILILGSLVAGLAWNEPSLNISRAVQGIGSAFIAPAALSMIMGLFVGNAKDMDKALAFWGLSGAAGGALGIIFGGVLTDLLSWRWTLLIYVPLGLIVLFLSKSTLPRSARKSGKIDFVGAFLVTISLILIVLGIVNAEHNGWIAMGTLFPLVIGIVLFLLFILLQSRSQNPLLPLEIFKSYNLGIGNVAIFLIAASWFPMLYILVLYLQQVLQLSPLGSAAALLPMPLLMAFFMIFVSERIMNKLGLKNAMITGFIILGIGAMVFFKTATVEGSYISNVLLASILTSLGNALAYLPATKACVSSVEGEQSGLASGLYNTNYQIGSAIGLAVIVSISQATTKAHTSLSTIESLNLGFQQAFFWSGVIAFIGAILSLIFVKKQNN
uniref:MFS transporter n=1 Tax=Candidatus Enterococcus willemsii TaxID=1857215 RepID=UPI00403FB6FB